VLATSCARDGRQQGCEQLCIRCRETHAETSESRMQLIIMTTSRTKRANQLIGANQSRIRTGPTGSTQKFSLTVRAHAVEGTLAAIPAERAFEGTDHGFGGVRGQSNAAALTRLSHLASRAPVCPPLSPGQAEGSERNRPGSVDPRLSVIRTGSLGWRLPTGVSLEPSRIREDLMPSEAGQRVGSRSVRACLATPISGLGLSAPKNGHFPRHQNAATLVRNPGPWLQTSGGCHEKSIP
jgi:hypothetical protein